MILECKSCQKKFIVPDNAIPGAGRLVQCSSCGNKWTQFPVMKKVTKKFITPPLKKETIKKQTKVAPKVKKENVLSNTIKKKKIVKKKTGPSIYSKEYLEEKHGIKIDGNNSNISKKKPDKKTSKSYFGFYSYLFIFLFTIVLFVGILNLTKEIIIFYFPFTKIYLEYLFENLNNFGIIFRDAFNIY